MGVIGRSEFGLEIVLAVAYQVYILGLSFDKACALLSFFTCLDLKNAQANALMNQLAREWESEIETLCGLLLALYHRALKVKQDRHLSDAGRKRKITDLENDLIDLCPDSARWWDESVLDEVEDSCRLPQRNVVLRGPGTDHKNGRLLVLVDLEPRRVFPSTEIPPMQKSNTNFG